MALFRVNDMNAKKSVVVANAGRAVVVVLGNAIDVDVNKHDDGTSRPEDVCDFDDENFVGVVCLFFLRVFFDTGVSSFLHKKYTCFETFTRRGNTIALCASPTPRRRRRSVRTRSA